MSVFNAYMSLSGATDATVTRDEKLAHHTTLRVGGPAKLWIVAHGYTGLARVITVLDKERVPWVVLGRGSNVLASDAGFDGAVITLDDEFARLSIGEDGLVTAGAGLLLSKLVNEAMKRGLSGLEPCVGIPGTVGGAVSMDAGTRHEWIGRRVHDVVTYRPGEGMRRYDGGEIEWGYRQCTLPPDEVILEASFLLMPADKSAIAADMDARLRRRRQAQPVGKPSCGSVFVNPGTSSVGMLIEGCGLKGCIQGGAQVSTTHANFIVNNGGATAADVVTLMRTVHDAVLKRYKVDLRPEVKLVGFGA